MDNLKTPLDKDFDYTCLERYLETKTDKVTFDPTASVFIDESRPLKLNYVMLWALCYVLTDKFIDSDFTIRKNYFLVPNQKYRDWHEGVRTGIDYLVSKKTDFSLESMDKIYASGVAARTQAAYTEILAFWKSEGTKPPPVETVPPLPPDPVPPAQTTPPASAPGGWKLVVSGILGAIAIPWFFVQMFLPGGVVKLVNLVIEFLHKLIGM